MLQPLQPGQAALASRTVSWNPANFSQAMLPEGEKDSNPDVGRNSQADYAPGLCCACVVLIPSRHIMAWHIVYCSWAMCPRM